jgi:recombination protein RecR
VVPDAIQKFIEAFSRLPAIGPRLATRLAFYLAGQGGTQTGELVAALAGLGSLERCPRCSFFKPTGAPLCRICGNAARDRATIALVERETDLIALERTGRFTGTYFLMGELPERGAVTPELRERFAKLKALITGELNGKAKEIVIAFGLNTFGDFAAQTVRQEFKELAEKITRLGRGIPTGGEIEFADEETLGSALERRN